MAANDPRNSLEHQEQLAFETLQRMAEEDDLRLMAMAILADVVIERRAQDVRLLAMAGCTPEEARAYLKEFE
jgi:hypothetical protein